VTVDELVRLLADPDFVAKSAALRWAQAAGEASAGPLCEVLRHPAADVPAKVWAMLALPRGAGLGPEVRAALRAMLGDGSPTVRRTAIRTLVAFRDLDARAAIAHLVDDQAVDPSAWFDDDATVAMTARAALRELGPK
jgi:HEAT repeat protein